MRRLNQQEQHEIFAENDIGESEEKQVKPITSRSDGSVHVKIKKKTLRNIIIGICAIVVAIGIFFSQTRKIEGTWVRQSDDTNIAGMTVNVEHNSGIIQSVPSQSDTYFKNGEVKWNSIRKVGWGKYKAYDLASYVGGKNIVDPNASTLTVSLDGKRLQIDTPFSSGLNPETGLHQVWIRQ